LLTRWAIRAELSARGREVSDAQLKRFDSFGLLPHVDGGFATNSPDLVAEILKSESIGRSLPRRVVFLRGDYLRFPVPAEALRRALIELAGTIPQPIRKLRKLELAWDAMARRGTARRRSRSDHVPVSSSWPDILATVPVTQVDMRATSWYHLARDVLPMFGREVNIDLTQIPLEERVVMVALLDTIGAAAT
jgi:hypothetical protein